VIGLYHSCISYGTPLYSVPTIYVPVAACAAAAAATYIYNKHRYAKDENEYEERERGIYDLPLTNWTMGPHHGSTDCWDRCDHKCQEPAVCCSIPCDARP
jgi:hypothetical protein